MNKTVLALVLAACAATAGAADYKIDSAHTNARFAIDHFNTSTNVGGFYGIEGGLQFDAAKRTGSIDVRVLMKNLQNGLGRVHTPLEICRFVQRGKIPRNAFCIKQIPFFGQPRYGGGRPTDAAGANPSRAFRGAKIQLL